MRDLTFGRCLGLADDIVSSEDRLSSKVFLLCLDLHTVSLYSDLDVGWLFPCDFNSTTVRNLRECDQLRCSRLESNLLGIDLDVLGERPGLTHRLSSDSESVSSTTDLNLYFGISLDSLFNLDVLASSTIIPPELVDVIASYKLVFPVKKDG